MPNPESASALVRIPLLPGSVEERAVDVFQLRQQVVAEYGSFVRSFLTIRDQRIEKTVERELLAGRLWPDPLIQLNPAFEPGDPLERLIAQGVLHPECQRIFSIKDERGVADSPLRLHHHQVQSILAANVGDNYVLTTGTGSGKSLSYIVPIVDHVLRRGSGRGIQAISRDKMDYIMDTFPIVRRSDERAHGEYRTRRFILEIYDEMQKAIESGRPCQTRLDPPPADARVAHGPREADLEHDYQGPVIGGMNGDC